MILLLIFLLISTAFLLFSLHYQIESPENRFIEYLPEHGSNEEKEDIEITYTHAPIVKEYRAIQIGVVIASIGFIIYAICCIRRKLYGRMEIVSFVLSLVYWATGALIIRM